MSNDARHPAPLAAQQPPEQPPLSPETADDPQSLVDQVLRQVGDVADMAAGAMHAESGENDSNEPESFDLAALEREIEHLLSPSTETNTGKGLASKEDERDSSLDEVETTVSRGETPPADAVSESPEAEFEALAEALDPTQRRDDSAAAIRSAAIEAEPTDPALREIDAALVDDTSAILEAHGGDLDAALGSVFDPRVLAGQEEDVNRALIEAFGSSRLPWRAGEPGVVTNPASGFSDGPSREMPPGTPRVELDRTPTPPATPAPTASHPMPPRTFEEIGASSIARDQAPEYAGETPFEPAFPAVPITPAASDAGAGAAEPTATIAAVDRVEEAASVEANGRTDTESVVATGAPRTRRPRPDLGAILRAVARVPIVVAATPMRAVPVEARRYVGLVAATLLLMVPVAWWLAQSKAGARGVGPVVFTGATAAASGEPAADAGGH